jgi:flavin reductase (DIM6/NTAB) family NADH-FMN oxidoreductase RutF
VESGHPPLAEAMNLSCAAAPPEVDEFALAGVTPLASQLVQPPRVAESPVAFECRCSQIVRLKTAAGQDTDAWLILGRWWACTSPGHAQGWRV